MHELDAGRFLQRLWLVVWWDTPTKTFAAGLSMYMLFKMVAPSFVTIAFWPRPMLCKILSCIMIWSVSWRMREQGGIAT